MTTYNKNDIAHIDSGVLSRIESHPLSDQDLVMAVLTAWEGLLKSKIGSKPCQIGIDLFPKPQLVGSLLHELIPFEVIRMFPSDWRIDACKDDKDLEHLKNNDYSIEIKTSSSRSGIYGNRSYPKTDGRGKPRGTYLLAVNFDKIEPGIQPKIRLIRFGYVEAEDWISQAAESGQQCRLSHEASKNKLIELYRCQ